MKRVGSVKVILGVALAATLFFGASTASAQTALSSSSSLGCLPPDFVGENLYSGYQSSSGAPAITGNSNTCNSFCRNLYVLCKHNVGSQNQCMRRMIRNLQSTGRTLCRGESNPDDVRSCNQEIKEDTNSLWSWNNSALDDGQHYCRDMQVSCNQDCNAD